MTFTNEEKEMIKEFLKSKGINVHEEKGYDLFWEPDKFYEKLMDDYNLAFSYKGGKHIEEIK